MNKKAIITFLLTFVGVAGMAQTQTTTATINGCSPALKEGTEATCLIDMTVVASDTVRNGRFSLSVPVEKLTMCNLILHGEGCPNSLMTLFVAPDVTTDLAGTDCLFPLWSVDSPLPEQQTQNRITAYTHEKLAELLRMSLANAPWDKEEPVYIEMQKQTMDVLPSLPVDLASLTALSDVAHYARNTTDFPYMEQLRTLEQEISARATDGFEAELAIIHALVYPPHVLQPGEAVVDADLFDMDGNVHHLAEQQGRYVLLDFWSLGCGPCRMAEPEMRAMRVQLQGRLEIVGINRDKMSEWQKSDWSKNIVWPNWSDGKMGKGGIEAHYCHNSSVPYYVLLSPDQHVVCRQVGYGPGQFLGLATAIKGPQQDNSANLSLAIRKVDAGVNRTSVSFRYYGSKDHWFRIVSSSYLEADGKRYKMTGANGITLDTEAYPSQKVTTATDGIMSTLYYADFTLIFEPFDNKPATFDFKEGDEKNAFIIRNISF